MITQYLRGVWPQSTLLEIAADPMAPLGQPCKVCLWWQTVKLRYNVPSVNKVSYEISEIAR